MKWNFTTIFVLWIVAKVLCGEGHSCKVTKKGDCISTIDYGFSIETKTFTLRHVTLIGDEEIVAVCDWMAGVFDCVVGVGYSINIISHTTLDVSVDSDVTCPNGNFIFISNGDEQVPCSLDVIKDTTDNSSIAPVVLPVVTVFIAIVIAAVVLWRRRKRVRKI